MFSVSISVPIIIVIGYSRSSLRLCAIDILNCICYVFNYLLLFGCLTCRRTLTANLRRCHGYNTYNLLQRINIMNCKHRFYGAGKVLQHVLVSIVSYGNRYLNGSLKTSCCFSTWQDLPENRLLVHRLTKE